MLRSTLKDESISKSGLVIIGSASKYSAKYIYIFIIFSFINKASGGNAQLLNSYETWDANPRIIPSTDPAGIGYNSTNGRFYIVDSEINEPGGEWNNVNVFETNAVGGTLYNSYLTVGSSIEPTGICWSPSNNSYYVVNDNTNRLYRYQIISGNLVKQDDWALGASPFSIDDAEGLTINPGNGHIYIVDGASGDKKVVAVQIISGNLVHISQESFSVSGTVDDPEGIAYRPYDGHLYIVSSPDEGIFEYDVNGNKLDFYNISGFTPTPINPQGLTFGPRSSNPNFDALYIADGGIDNGEVGDDSFKDGVIYEAKIGDEDVSLPVQLASFGIEYENNTALLSWKTESELNNLGFEILKANEKEGHYNVISSYLDNPDIYGRGNSSIGHQYKFYDKQIRPGNSYWYMLVDISYEGVKTYHGPINLDVPEDSGLPLTFKLHQNYPNPFNPSTNFKIEISNTMRGESGFSLIIYNSLGQRIKTLRTQNVSDGLYTLRWDGTTDSGNPAPAGTYFVSLTIGSQTKIIKSTLLR